jgi:hypothetical protein
VNCCVKPFAMAALPGATLIVTSTGAPTVRAARLLLTPPDAAVMLVVPVASALARPEPLMVATAVADELHVAAPVKFAVVESV